MGIQINGQTDTITATDGSLTVSGADLGSASASSLNISGIVTASGFSGNVTGNINSSGVSTFSGGVVVAAGSTSAPSISPTGDSNTGIFFPSPDTVAIGEGGNEAMRIDSSSRLLVGTSTARSNFFNSTGTAAAQIEGTTGDNSSLSITRCANNAGNGYLALNKSRSSSVGGNTVVNVNDYLGEIRFQGNDGTEFVEAANIRAEVDGTPGANDMPGRLVFSTTADGASSPTERMRITNNGSTFINTTSVAASGSILSLGGSVTWGCGPQPGSSTFYVYNPANAGVYITSGANTWSSSSDERLKTIQSEILDGLSKVSALRAVNFTWKSDETNAPQVGLIAQDVQTVLPEAVTEDQGYLGVKYTDLIPLLVSALKESKERIETLEARLTAAGIE